MYPTTTSSYSAQTIKPARLCPLIPVISVKMGLLVLVAATLTSVQGFGIGPSLEWKDGDAEMWTQVVTMAW